MTLTYILRVWMPDRPGALGQVASRVGAVGGDVVGIDILERGAGRAIDELVVELLIAEMQQVDGVDVESITPATDSLRDPRLDALETAAILVGASTRSSALEELCVHSVRTIGAAWSVVVELEGTEIVAQEGEAPAVPWLVAYVHGSQSSAKVAGGNGGPDDVIWAPLPATGMALVLGREGTPFHARERRQAAALARIVDTRFRELTHLEARRLHPSCR
ncbi:MAG: hypothetical protein ACXWCM_11225 [Acidimicrobiales bacterium]